MSVINQQIQCVVTLVLTSRDVQRVVTLVLTSRDIQRVVMLVLTSRDIQVGRGMFVTLNVACTVTSALQMSVESFLRNINNYVLWVYGLLIKF